LIVDARSINQRYREAPPISLATGDAMNRIEIPAGLALHVAHVDVDNYFHRLRLPKIMQKWFGLPPVQANFLGMTSLGGLPLESEDMVHPLLTTQPMWLSWAMFFAQRSHEFLIEHVPGFDEEARLRDRKPGWALKPEVPAHLQYVDNLAVLGVDQGKVNKMKDEGKLFMNKKGLLMHGGVHADGGSVELLGMVIHQSKPLAELKEDRSWRLAAALQHCVRLRKIRGAALEELVGHCTFAFLLRRCLLSVLGRTYQFIKEHYLEPTALWPSVRQELANAAALLPLASATLHRPWCSTVWCVDAATHGLGVRRAEWAIRSVAEVGRA